MSPTPALGIVGDAEGVVRREGDWGFSLLRRLYGCEDMVHIAGFAIEEGEIRRIGRWRRSSRVVAASGQGRLSSISLFTSEGRVMDTEPEVAALFQSFGRLQDFARSKMKAKMEDRVLREVDS